MKNIEIIIALVPVAIMIIQTVVKWIKSIVSEIRKMKRKRNQIGYKNISKKRKKGS